MAKDLCLDVETTTYNTGSPFDRRNELVCIAYTDGTKGNVVRCDVRGLEEVQSAIDGADRIVGFNLKFDLHWLRRVGLDFSRTRAYDVQAAEFVLSGQTHKFPSLDEVAFKYLGQRKIDEVAAYWERGVQTTDIPWDTLSKYAMEDVRLTLACASQQHRFIGSLAPVINLVNHDLLVLEEMEWNGLRFDREKALAKAEEVQKRIDELQKKHGIEQQIPNFNWGSGDHLSALLYGGVIREPIKVPVGHFKTGAKAGQEKFKNDIREHILPRKYNPPKGSESKKEGVYSTDENTLLSIKGGKRGLLEDLLEIRKLQKEINTYLRGFPEKQDEGCYDKEYIYGQFNQCVASTGRLSSSKPNLQNLSEEIGKCLVSRY